MTLRRGSHQCHKKAWEEHHGDSKIEMEENKKQDNYPEVHIPLETLQRFPAFNSYTWSLEFALGATSTKGHRAFAVSLLSRSLDSQADFLLVSMSLTASHSSPSFCIGSLQEDSPSPSSAQMMRVGKAKSVVQPKTAPKKGENSIVPPATMMGRVITRTTFLCLFSKISSARLLKQHS